MDRVGPGTYTESGPGPTPTGTYPDIVPGTSGSGRARDLHRQDPGIVPGTAGSGRARDLHRL